MSSPKAVIELLAKDLNDQGGVFCPNPKADMRRYGRAACQSPTAQAGHQATSEPSMMNPYAGPARTATSNPAMATIVTIRL